MQKYTLNKCPQCGANYFLLSEKTTYKAGINKDGILASYALEDFRIEKIVCKECKTKYMVDDFIDIDLAVW